MKLKKVINKVVLESGFTFIRESKKEGEGDCSMQRGGKKELLFDILAYGIWAHGKTEVNHRVRLKDADSLIEYCCCNEKLIYQIFLILP